MTADDILVLLNICCGKYICRQGILHRTPPRSIIIKLIYHYTEHFLMRIRVAWTEMVQLAMDGRCLVDMAFCSTSMFSSTRFDTIIPG
jgi:hypothetical protein